MLETFAVLVVALGGWLLWDGMKARETANDVLRAACRSRGLLFLDDTVALTSIRLARDEEGHAKLRRTYRFDYSDSGDNRLRGTVALLGTTIVEIRLDPRSLSGYAG